MELSRTKQKAARRKAEARTAKKERNQLARKVKAAAREATRAPAVHVDPPAEPPKTARERKRLERAGERWVMRGPVGRVPTGPNTSVLVSVNRKARRTNVARQRATAALVRAAERRQSAKERRQREREEAEERAS